MNQVSLSTQFQQVFERSCTSWQGVFNLIISHIEPIQQENKALRSQIQTLQNTQSQQSEYIDSIRHKLQEIQSLNENNNNNKNVNELLIADTLQSDQSRESHEVNPNINDLPATIPASQYISETHHDVDNNNNVNNNDNNNNNTNNEDDDDALTLMQTEEEDDDDDDDDDIDMDDNKGNNNNIIHIDDTLSMRQVSPIKPPHLEVGTLAFPENMNDEDEEQEIEATQIDEEREEREEIVDDNEADNFYAGFGVNTEPSESQAILGLNLDELLLLNENNNNNAKNIHCIANQVESATQLIEHISCNNITKFNYNSNMVDIDQCPTQILPSTQINNSIPTQIVNQEEDQRDLPTQIIPNKNMERSQSNQGSIYLSEDDKEQQNQSHINNNNNNNNHNNNNNNCHETIIISSDGENDGNVLISQTEFSSGTLRSDNNTNNNNNNNHNNDVPNSLGLQSVLPYKPSSNIHSIRSGKSNNNHNNHNNHNNNNNMMEHTELISDVEDLNSTTSSATNNTSNIDTNISHKQKRKITVDDLKFPTNTPSQKTNNNNQQIQQSGKKRKSFGRDTDELHIENKENKENMSIHSNIKSPPTKRMKLMQPTLPQTIPETQFESVDNRDIDDNANNKPLPRRKLMSLSPKKKPRVSVNDADKALLVLQGKYGELSREHKHLTENNLWNDMNASINFKKKFEEYTKKCQGLIHKLTKKNVNKKYIAIVHFLIANTEINYGRNKSQSETDKIAEKHAKKGIECDHTNYKGYAVLAYIRKRNGQYSDAIAAYQQCVEFCSDSKKRSRFEKEIKQIRDMMASRNKN